MKKSILNALERNQLVDIIYISKKNEITKRKVKILKVLDHDFIAYCFTRHSPRTFIINNVLAIMPVTRNEREVV
ncbi:WYL domain-containing protein [Ureibacillus thermosphaericus]|uniref:Putative DNA-binding transcriptional regulator YafY n=1 Tax=Ureibacillus thermosphaericus TaxID=51173 RepID=A0A840PTY7_URETH|nr:transcriptional regulator [Ureibacillus thermosphaericus]MBB5148674.1 putative DNA-binding transcriptional regulator YafY [Ureibacillus thermosphaericus]NKZ31390.1 transcriptional regulator [Ureibacillus thermosphaericus]